MIDGYSLQARLVPVLVAALPLVLLGVIALPGLAGIQRVLVLALVAALLPLFDQIGRARGRRCEPALFAAWGGPPTTQLLRWRGPASPAVVSRRHQAVERATGIELPAADDESSDPAGADEAYAEAVRTLRTLTGGTREVQVENRHYGFRRNMLGLRWWGCLAAAVSLAAAGTWAGLAAPSAGLLSALGVVAIADLSLLALWLAVATKPWVQEAASAYAERLIGQAGLTGQARPAPGPARAPASPVTPPPAVAVLTALAGEFAAVGAVLRRTRPVTGGPAGDPNLYSAGELPSRDPDIPHHVVATVLPYAGTRSAAAVVTDLLRSFPTIRCVIFSGVAGGVPGHGSPAGGIRLGDVLVAVDGIVDYDHTRTVDGEERLRRRLHGLSADMLRAVQELRAAYADPGVPLRRELSRVTDPRFAPPGGPPAPRVHFGAIGSADRLLRDAARRDQLASRHGICGVEMESSGLAVGASLRGVPWFVVRGVADYCDDRKDKAWQPYAALTAAAFVAVLLGHCRPLSAEPVAP